MRAASVLRGILAALLLSVVQTADASIGITGAEVENILSQLDDSLPRRNEFIARRRNHIYALQREF